MLDEQAAGLKRSVCMVKINGQCQRILVGLGKCWIYIYRGAGLGRFHCVGE